LIWEAAKIPVAQSVAGIIAYRDFLGRRTEAGHWVSGSTG
jgi:hypothetical protein